MEQIICIRKINKQAPRSAMMSQGCREQEKAVIGRDTGRIKSVDFKL